MANYKMELEAIQIWIKATAGLNSYKLSEAKPKVARPVILWETPNRAKARNISQHIYVQAVRQYGRLFTKDLDEVLDIQEKLSDGLEEVNNILSIVQDDVVIGRLKAVTIEFTESDGLDVPFSIKYEVTYSKTKPVDAPPATFVGTKVDVTYAPKVYRLDTEDVGMETAIEYPAPVEYTEQLAAVEGDENVDENYTYTGTANAGQIVV